MSAACFSPRSRFLPIAGQRFSADKTRSGRRRRRRQHGRLLFIGCTLRNINSAQIRRFAAANAKMQHAIQSANLLVSSSERHCKLQTDRKFQRFCALQIYRDFEHNKKKKRIFRNTLSRLRPFRATRTSRSRGFAFVAAAHRRPPPPLAPPSPPPAPPPPAPMRQPRVPPIAQRRRELPRSLRPRAHMRSPPPPLHDARISI